MNVIEYVKKYGNYSFAECEFNEVDNVILASLSYLNFKGILLSSSKKTIKEAAELFFNTYSKREQNNNISSVKTAIKILSSIQSSRRYQGLVLSRYIEKNNGFMQFSALCINIKPGLVYISFEGTDDSVIGWQEDAEMSYHYPVAAQREAIRYINSRIHPFSRKKYILGGHSKGGNLALVAGMHANHFIRNKIINIYVNDGPGLKEQQLKSREYKRIRKRIISIIPNYSVVGLLLHHNVQPKIILSSKNNIFAHNIINWEITDNHFTTSELSKFSQKFDSLFKEWLKNYDDLEREKFVHDLFSIFNRVGINSVLELKKGKLPKIVKMVKESKQMSPKTKKMINELIKLLLSHFKEANPLSKTIQSIKH